MSMIALRPYQLEAVEAVERAEVQRPLAHPAICSLTVTWIVGRDGHRDIGHARWWDHCPCDGCRASRRTAS